MKLTVCVRLAFATVLVACARPEDVPAQADSGTDGLATSRDPIVRAASAALASGRPWRATELLDSAFRDAEARTTEATLLAAVAAAGWGGWSRVERELADARWVDSLFGGRGRELLARAALSRGADSLAHTHAARAIGSATTDRARGVRLVLLARALDRLAMGDSAAASYRRAARQLPSVKDWLELRAAGTTADASRRRQSYARVTSAVARTRIAPTEAQARERWGDLTGAAAAYVELGQRAEALRLRLAVAVDDAALAAVRREAFALLASAPAAETRAAVALIDSALGPVSRAEELIVARAANRAGLLSRAATAFARAEPAKLTAADRYNHGMVLSRLGRDAAAAAQLAKVPRGTPVSGTAAYQRARSLLRAGQGTASRAALRRVARDHARDTTAAAHALFLLSDLATDEGRDPAARATFIELARRYPSSNLAPVARFRAAIISYAAGSFAEAAQDFESLVERYPRSVETTAARYWAGRSRARLGQRELATQRWHDVMTNDPLSYYAVRSARQLGVASWKPEPATDTMSTPPALERAVERAALLEELGMATEEGFEYARMASDAGSSADSLIMTADALRQRGELSRAIGLARRAQAASARRDTRLFRLLYPIAFEDVIRAEAGARDIDVALVAALIHQESSFNPRATSRANARGLMQVLPNVGAAIAKSHGIAGFERVLLYQPDVNIRLGTIHLDAMLDQYPAIAYALAAYNAGGTPVRRWRQKRGSGDPELFVERIPYSETRDYVRILLRNQATYKALYGW